MTGSPRSVRKWWRIRHLKRLSWREGEFRGKERGLWFYHLAVSVNDCFWWLYFLSITILISRFFQFCGSLFHPKPSCQLMSLIVECWAVVSPKVTDHVCKPFDRFIFCAQEFLKGTDATKNSPLYQFSVHQVVTCFDEIRCSSVPFLSLLSTKKTPLTKIPFS